MVTATTVQTVPASLSNISLKNQPAIPSTPQSSACPTLLNNRHLAPQINALKSSQAINQSITSSSSMKQASHDSTFSWSYTDEPHVSRRRAILAAHPEIEQLFGPEPLTGWLVLILVTLQVSMAYFMRDASWPLLFVCAYVIGGTVNHSLQLAVHELSHNLGSHHVVINKWIAIFANLPTGFPSSVSFQKYHMDHHQYQGHDGIDTDIPTLFEVQIFQGPTMKLLWILMQPIFYALRPAVVKPKSFGKWELCNVACCITFNLMMNHVLGTKALCYLLIGTILGLGLHPTAGHFIAEHYEFMLGQETYSYYGSANFFNFNVGYHNEHHDFPRIPWSRLPLVTKIAPEYYLTLPHYTSYLAVIYAYITDSRVGPFARVKRQTKQSNDQSIAERVVDQKKQVWAGRTVLAVAFTWFIAVFAYVVTQVW